jgi:hypothetical protein
MLAVVTQVTSFHDCNEPRLSLATQLVARLRHHLVDKDPRIFGRICQLLGDPAAQPVAWAECFPDPNQKPRRAEPTDAFVAYEPSGYRHWTKQAKPEDGGRPGEVGSPAASPRFSGSGLLEKEKKEKKEAQRLREAEAVLVSAGGATLVTTTESKLACLPLLPGSVPVSPLARQVARYRYRA